MSAPELKDDTRESLGNRVIGNYELLRELGRGAMGVVYKAHETSLNRVVALKVLPQHLARDEAFLKRFQREARTVAQLNHPNVVTIYNIGRDDGVHYIAMEYVKGKPLSEMIEDRGKIEKRQALEIARQVAGALDAAHRMQIIHRDIKPHNIMVDDMGRAKVLDFGIAKVQEEQPTGLTHTGQVLGTPHYMAPEQCRGLELDGRSDVYALGVTLYEMLAGALPFTGQTAVVVIQRILFEEPTSLRDFAPDLPESVYQIINKSMARDITDRFHSAEAMEAALRKAILDLDSQTATPAPEIPPPEPESETNLEPRRIPVRSSTFSERFIDAIKARRNRNKWAIMGGVFVFVLILMFALKPDSTVNVEASKIPGESAPAAAAVAQPIAPVIPDLPQIEWVVAPNDATTLTEKTIEIAWKPTNDVMAQSYLVGLNQSEPDLALQQTSATLELQTPGDQFILVVPVTADGLRGRALERRFAYAPIDSLQRALDLYSGVGGKVDEAKAREDLLALAAQGDVLASSWLAWFQWWGRCGFPKDTVVASQVAEAHSAKLRDLAEKGDPGAMFLFGAALDQGMGIAADPAAALDWVTRAAQAGQTIAMNYLGWMCVEGRGTEKDATNAVAWFAKAAEAGDTGAMHNYGWMLANGSGVAKDEAAALDWFKRAAEAGSARNMGNVGVLTHQGRGTAKDIPAAIEWYRSAARLGDETSRKNLKALRETW